MSAFIPAEVGRTYLMIDGRRLRVLTVSARWGVTYEEHPGYPRTVSRFYFENSVESVLS